jgi:hypothetical protein
MSPIDPKLIISLIERATKRSPADAVRGLTPLNISLIRFAGSQEYNSVPAGYPAASPDHSSETATLRLKKGSGCPLVLMLRPFRLVAFLAARCRALSGARLSHEVEEVVLCYLEF